MNVIERDRAFIGLAGRCDAIGVQTGSRGKRSNTKHDA
jgi:hypothetical protein